MATEQLPALPALADQKRLREELVVDHGAGMSRHELERLHATLNSSWEKRIVDDVRRIVRNEDQSSADKVAELAAFVKEAGLEPPPRPEPLPHIERDDIQLVCWMAVSAAA